VAVYCGFSYVFSIDYSSSRNIALLLMIGFLLLSFSSFLINFLLFYRRPRLILFQTFLITMIHVMLSFILIKKYALLGVLLTQFVTSLLTFVSTLLVCHILTKSSQK
ncbi:TPA: O24 family O-antigen flippase, partial [Escherichia coli]|nr:O24 family O-antigen flippase [Escherichia coli]HBE7805036.1 O24 family O-antigen flippase [Escherichia coli]